MNTYIPSKTIQSFVSPFSVSHLLRKSDIFPLKWLHVLKQPCAFKCPGYVRGGGGDVDVSN